MLTSYLQKKTLEGCHDSIGEFSFAPASAQRVLGSNLFSDSCSYLLKFVQAANLANCRILELKLKGPFVEIRLESWSDESGAAQALYLGALGLQTQDPLALIVDKTPTGILVRAQRSLDRLREFRRETAFLRDHARYSKVPVYLNNRRLDRPGPPERFSKPVWNELLPHGTVLSECELPGGGGQVYLRIGLQHKAEIFFVRSGAVAGKHEIEFPVRGIQAVVDADRLTTDFGGLEIVEDQNYYRVLERVKEAARALRADVQENIDQLVAKTEPFSLGAKVRWQKRVSGTALGIVGVGAGLLALTGDVVMGTFLLGSPLLACATVATASLAGTDVLEPGEESHRRLREQILSRLK